jgi:hypothetical protein
MPLLPQIVKLPPRRAISGVAGAGLFLTDLSGRNMTEISKNRKAKSEFAITKSASELKVQRIGLVARDYNHLYPNGCKDFSHALKPTLEYLDRALCDTVLFSLFSIIPRRGFNLFANLRLSHVKAIFFEKFTTADDDSRLAGDYIVAVATPSGWHQYVVRQAFGSLSKKSAADIHHFVQNEFGTRRIFGNCCLVICGESNAVKYVPAFKRVADTFGMREAIPQSVSIVLNPVHDRMTRFEMMKKRHFLSEHNRWVISVWNKGKINRLGQTRDGKSPPWTVFHDGKLVAVSAIPNDWNVEIGILDVGM